jgi:hypothetical protein
LVLMVIFGIVALAPTGLPMTSDYIDLLHTSDLLALPPATWLMHTLIPEHGRVGLYGDPGGGKSFIALDWAMHISEGMSWLGRYPTKQAPVIYIAAEGGRGIQKRVREWMRFYGKQDLAAMYWLLEPLYVREEGVVQDFPRYPRTPRHLSGVGGVRHPVTLDGQWG